MDSNNTENRKKRAVTEGVKIGSNALISLALVAVLLIADMFTLDNFQIEMAKASYWVSKILSTAGTYCLMIAFSNIVEGAKVRKDNEFNDKLDSLDTHYSKVMENGESEFLELFILNKNKNAKYQVFIEKWKTKLKKAEKKGNKQKAEIAKYMLVKSVDEVWDEEKVKYNRITTPQLFSGATDISSKFGEDDIQVRKGYFAFKKLITKALMLLLGSFSISDLVYSFGDFTKAMIIPLILRIIVILIAIYSGICFGSFIVDRMKITLKTKLKILSQFRARLENKDFSIAPDKDLVVEKVTRELKPPIQQAIEDTFKAGKPVKMGALVGEVIKDAIDYEAQKAVQN